MRIFLYINILISYNIMSGLQFSNSTDFNNTRVTTQSTDDNVVILENKKPSVSPNQNKVGFNSRPTFSDSNLSSEGRRVKIRPTLNSFDFDQWQIKKK